MTVIAHISDLHFGTEDREVASALAAELDVSLVVISGDLTQRARTEQFRAARVFLDDLRAPYLVVPGNHDIPLYDLFSRFAHPLARYRDHVTDELMPTFFGDDLAVVGLNTAHGFTFKGGRVTREQAEAVRDRLAASPARWKAVVAHHPFVVPSGGDPDQRVDGADVALPIFQEAGVDMLLTGHLHVAYASDEAGFRSDDRTIVAVHAGTCISTRRRGEPNGYNRLTVEGADLTIVHRVWDGERFADGASKTYRR
jgi:3',5'-cyclic AMP phosphodiesterase CpdA